MSVTELENDDVHSTKSEDFLSTVRTTAARPGQVVDVVVLTSDAGLLEALRSSAGSEHALWDVPSADAAVDYLVGGRCDVLIADLGIASRRRARRCWTVCRCSSPS